MSHTFVIYDTLYPFVTAKLLEFSPQTESNKFKLPIPSALLEM